MANKNPVNKGDRFGRWTIIKEVEGIRYSHSTYVRRFLCICDCGTERVVRYDYLKNGKSKSCGCLLGDINKTRQKYDGDLVHSRLYNIWNSMKQRCYYPKAISYKFYGAKGITVCKEWLDDFQNFYDWAITNGYSDELTIDRIDSKCNYEPSNCRWVTQKENQNNKSSNVWVTYNGESHTLAIWGDILGIQPQTLSYRINRAKWSIEKAFTTPVKKYNSNLKAL